MPFFDAWKKYIKPRPGQHIRVKRQKGLLVYYHHGIYVSDSEVINFNGEPGKKDDEGSLREQMKNARIVRSTLRQFLAGGELEVNTAQRRNPPETIIKIARSMIGNRCGQYDVVINNCEHFCNECCDGNHASKQVQKAVAGVGIGLSSIAAGIIGLIAINSDNKKASPKE